ncbi:hypothetical protein FAES_4740 [Fibrella aestuarina BUZ 2]|uniref:Uncharacterized protein n=1 Tax=Fibrella aestuarina BUZ 2 TaxID=1166018 RepID=I0KF36_9BACT|nr:hypothetical protein FAES_4740 [Fibrella aestuarina BUZ 2]
MPKRRLLFVYAVKLTPPPPARNAFRYGSSFSRVEPAEYATWRGGWGYRADFT